VILGIAEGLSNAAGRRGWGCAPGTVSNSRGRFGRYGLAGLADALRSGRLAHYRPAHERRVLVETDGKLKRA
jgi:hypothetical protein